MQNFWLKYVLTDFDERLICEVQSLDELWCPPSLSNYPHNITGQKGHTFSPPESIHGWITDGCQRKGGGHTCMIKRPLHETLVDLKHELAFKKMENGERKLRNNLIFFFKVFNGAFCKLSLILHHSFPYWLHFYLKSRSLMSGKVLRGGGWSWQCEKTKKFKNNFNGNKGSDAWHHDSLSKVRYLKQSRSRRCITKRTTGVQIPDDRWS